MTTLAMSWRCLTCPAHGDGPDADREAERHTKRARHATVASGRPA